MVITIGGKLLFTVMAVGDETPTAYLNLLCTVHFFIAFIKLQTSTLFYCAIQRIIW